LHGDGVGPVIGGMLRQCEASIAVARGANGSGERCVEAAIGGETLRTSPGYRSWQRFEQ
jgi:hypothetical protein